MILISAVDSLHSASMAVNSRINGAYPMYHGKGIGRVNNYGAYAGYGTRLGYNLWGGGLGRPEE